ELVHNGRVFEALKTIRAQYQREAELMGVAVPALPAKAAPAKQSEQPAEANL
ncbi:MAG TPA: flagellar biosynthesis repressor FlbT, partial [Ochrobactrum sp.]|nr:flagellar biosynthesis repressor FlbT [Ochrobactrum sp.]